MEKRFSGICFDNISDENFVKLRKMQRRRKTKQYPSIYKIIITCDRCDYDNLSELANNPEKGKRVGTFYFSNPDDLEMILAAFEGLFYQLFKIGEEKRMGSGVVDDLIWEDWWDIECPCVCEKCFLRNETVGNQYTCKRGNVTK